MLDQGCLRRSQTWLDGCASLPTQMSRAETESIQYSRDSLRAGVADVNISQLHHSHLEDRKCSAGSQVEYQQLVPRHEEHFLSIYRDPRATAVSMYFYKVMAQPANKLRFSLSESTVTEYMKDMEQRSDTRAKAKEVLHVSNFVTKGLRTTSVPEILRNIQDNVWREELQRRMNMLDHISLESPDRSAYGHSSALQICLGASSVFYEDMVRMGLVQYMQA